MELGVLYYIDNINMDVRVMGMSLVCSPVSVCLTQVAYLATLTQP